MPIPEPTGATAPETTLLTVEEAAHRLRLSVSILNKWRVSGAGPCFLKLGRRVVYAAGDLDAWVATARRRSTSAL